MDLQEEQVDAMKMTKAFFEWRVQDIDINKLFFFSEDIVENIRAFNSNPRRSYAIDLARVARDQPQILFKLMVRPSQMIEDAIDEPFSLFHQDTEVKNNRVRVMREM